MKDRITECGPQTSAGDMAGLAQPLARVQWEKTIPVVERLQDAQRPGGPMTFSLEQILQLFAIACEKPENYGRPISHWTPRELADEVVKLGLSRAFLSSSCGAIDGRSRFETQQVQYWLNPRPRVR